MKLTRLITLQDGIAIFADDLQWVLQVDNKNHRTYFVCLADLFLELYDIRLRRSGKKIRKNNKELKELHELAELVRSGREQTWKDIKHIKRLLDTADRRRKKGRS